MSATPEHGIQQTPYGYLVRVHVAPHPRQAKRFKAGTKLSTMRDWRDRTRRRLTQLRDRMPLPEAQFPVPVTALDGYCYIYFAASDGYVKIGRAVNPKQRLAELAVGSAHPITLLAAVLGHWSLEALVQKRYEASRRNGEWYGLTPELVQFIQRVRAGANPAELLFHDGNLSWLPQFPPTPTPGNQNGSQP
jgi:hypothetical protein